MLARLIAIVALLFAPLALAQTAAPAPAPAAEPGIVRVRVVTTAGDIVLALDTGRAPVTAGNFLRYVDARRFDGIVFYRAMKLDWGGLIQAGVRDAAKIYKPIAHEPTTQTGLSHVEGAVSMARFAPGTATADFTIMVGDMTGLDADPKASGDNAGFAVFGRVVEGMEVVKRIQQMPTSTTKGEGVMRGQMLDPEVKVLRVRREG